MRFILILIAMSFYAAPSLGDGVPKSLIACYYDRGKDFQNYSSCLSLAADLEKGGYSVTLLHQPTLEKLKEYRGKFSEGSLMFIRGHGNVLHPKTNESVVTGNKIADAPSPEYKHFIVRDHAAADGLVPTAELIEALDPVGAKEGNGKLFFAVDSCLGGQVCRETKACVGTSCARNEFAYAWHGEKKGEDHFVWALRKLVLGDVKTFKQYSNGSCEMNREGMTKYLEEHGAYKVFFCNKQFLNRWLTKGDVTEYKGTRNKNSEETCNERISALKKLADGAGKKISVQEDFRYLLTYKDKTGKRQIVSEPDDPAKGYVVEAPSVEAVKERLAHDELAKAQKWNWPASCGFTTRGEVRKDCDVYKVDGEVRPLFRQLIITSTEPFHKEGRPAVGIFEMAGKDSAKDRMIGTQTPQVDSFRLRHPHCRETMTSVRHSPAQVGEWDERGRGSQTHL